MNKSLAIMMLAAGILTFNCKNSNSIGSFLDHQVIDVKALPEISIPIFGIEAPENIPDTAEKTISYDELYSNLHVLNMIEPVNSITVQLTDPENNIFNEELLKNKKQFFITTEDIMSGKKYDKSVISIPFGNFAYFNSGIWKIKVKIDNDDNNSIENNINIDMKDMTILTKEIKNPVEMMSDTNIFKNSDTFIIYGNLKKINQELILGLYNFTNKMNDKNETILIPVIATKIITDNKGKFKIAYNIGNKMPKGEYYVVTGLNATKEKLGAHLFTGYFQIQ